MELVRQSFLAYLLSRVAEDWSDSRLNRLCLWLEEHLRRSAADSAVCRFLWREGTLPRRWEESWSRFLFAALLDIPCAVVRWIYRTGRGLWEGSFFCRCLLSLSGCFWVLLGGFALVMLSVPHDYWNNAYGFLGAVALAAFFVLGCGRMPRRRLEGAAFGPYMLFYLLCVASGLTASLSTRMSMRFFLFHAASFLFAMLMVSAVERLSQLRGAVALMTAGIVIAGVYGCWQGLTGTIAPGTDVSKVLYTGGRVIGRAYSFFDNPNNFAELLVMLIPLDLGLLLTARTWTGRLASLATLAPCLVSIGYTLSRSGWIGLALAVCVMALLLNWRLLAPLAILGVAALPFLPSSIYERVLSIGDRSDTSVSYRMAIYQSTFNLLRDYWLKGVGLGTDALGQAFRDYPRMYDGHFPIHTHNNYVEIWCETGLLGFLAYLALLANTAKTALRQFCRTADRDVRRMLAAAVGAFCGISVISLAEYTWFYPRNMFMYWMVFGVICACVKLGKQESAAEQ